jgi:transketolase
MEGVSSEAASLAGHLGLSEIVYLYDDNRISIEGSTDLAFTEDVAARFRAYNWFVQEIDGYDLGAIAQAINAAQAEQERPSLIKVRTHIGYGAPNLQDTAKVHGAAMGAAELNAAKENLGWPVEPRFYVPDEALTNFRKAIGAGDKAETEWNAQFIAYKEAYPQLAAEFEQRMRGELPAGWDANLPEFLDASKPLATRKASGAVLNAISPRLPALIGGSADLAPSNSTLISGAGDVNKHAFEGRNLHFGVREHAMGAMMNGLALHGGFIPYGGTFMVFSDYVRPAIRLAALMGAHVIYVLTHDSIGLGEDGPTHQPVEHLAALRAIPGLIVLRPADATETVVAWKTAIEHDGPVVLALTRQSIDILDRTELPPADGLAKGAYVLVDADGTPDVILMATGSEVQVALAAREILLEKGVQARVISMPSWELFERQSQAYKDAILPAQVTARLAVEAGVRQGWGRYVGLQGDVVSIDRFGASAPYKILWQEFGFTESAVADRALELVNA